MNDIRVLNFNLCIYARNVVNTFYAILKSEKLVFIFRDVIVLTRLHRNQTTFLVHMRRLKTSLLKLPIINQKF